MKCQACGLCGSSKLELIIDLGFHPLADTFLKPEQLSEPQTSYPLRVLLCLECGHAMSEYDVPAEKRYQENEYSYDSGNSKVSVSHFSDMAKEIIGRVGVGKDDLVVDVGSNVGTLLQAFRDQSGCKVLGVEPAPNMAKKAEENDVETIQDFFNETSAARILKIQKPKVITITNAFNHISGLTNFMKNIEGILAPDGAFVIEAPYLLHLVEKTAFDTIYLEHVSYFAIKPLVPFFKKFGLNIIDLEENEYMGGSVRIYVGRGEQSAKVSDHIGREEQAGLFSTDTYATFMKKVVAFKSGLMYELYSAKKNGGKIIALGAATKGNTLMNYCGIDSALVDFVTDSSPYKVGKYAPGSHIEIKHDDAITPDVTHALILPWNIADFLKEKLAPKMPGVGFIIPRMK